MLLILFSADRKKIVTVIEHNGCKSGVTFEDYIEVCGIYLVFSFKEFMQYYLLFNN